MDFQGKKIFLRSVLPADADFIFKLENDKSIWQVSGTKKPFTKQEIKNFISNQKDIYLDKQLRLIICLLPAPRVSDPPVQKKRGIGETENRSVGCIDLFNFNEKTMTAGVGILVDKKYRKEGYASEALTVLINYSFEVLNLKKLFCSISEDNSASLKLFIKHGFSLIGAAKGVCSFQLVNNRK
jgi:diamine N-acetyltransferase